MEARSIGDGQMKKWILVAVLAVVGAVLAACGGDDVKTASGESNDKVIKYQMLKANVYPIELNSQVLSLLFLMVFLEE